MTTEERLADALDALEALVQAVDDEVSHLEHLPNYFWGAWGDAITILKENGRWD